MLIDVSELQGFFLFNPFGIHRMLTTPTELHVEERRGGSLRLLPADFDIYTQLRGAWHAMAWNGRRGGLILIPCPRLTWRHCATDKLPQQQHQHLHLHPAEQSVDGSALSGERKEWVKGGGESFSSASKLTQLPAEALMLSSCRRDAAEKDVN